MCPWRAYFRVIVRTALLEEMKKLPHLSKELVLLLLCGVTMVIRSDDDDLRLCVAC